MQATPRREDFTRAFCREFGPSDFEDSAEALFKLRQLSTLQDYILEFRQLENRTSDLGSVLLKSCFIGGLRRELMYDVKLVRPHTVHDAIALYVQLDAKFAALKSGHTKQLLMLDLVQPEEEVDTIPDDLQPTLHLMELSECFLWHLC